MTRYDWPALTIEAWASTQGDIASTAVFDDFVAMGAPAGTPVSFDVRVSSNLRGSYETPSCLECGWPYGTGVLDLSVAGQSVHLASSNRLDTTVTRRLTVRAGEPFRLEFKASADAGYVHRSGRGVAQAVGTLTPIGLPPGVTLRSCWGYRTDVVVGIDVSLASATATHDAARLEWRTGRGASFTPMLERRIRDADWRTLAMLLPDGLGTLRYEDRDVVAGTVYEYRLSWSDGTGALRFTEPVVLSIPTALRFSFAGALPNPSRGALTFHFTLDAPGPARLELMDIAGRRVADVRLALAPGEYRHPLVLAQRLPPGIYTSRLRHGTHDVTRRVVIVP
jgi:hypothetical protein